MKQLFSIAGTVLLPLALTACGGGSSDGIPDDFATDPNPKTPTSALPKCEGLATFSKEKARALQATATVIAATETVPSHCRVDLVQSRVIGVRVGLPLSELDGGKGSTHGNWNGTIKNVGQGGVGGDFKSIDRALTGGYVGSMTDMGHTPEWCNAINAETGKPNSLPNCGSAGFAFMLDSEGKYAYPWQKTDFTVDSAIAQTKWALKLSETYYGKEADRNYFAGCSQGGGQAMALAQNAGELFDGIVAGAPAMQWGRLNTALLFPSVVVKDVVGLPEGLPTEKSDATTADMVKACDAKDGVVDGIMGDPQSCNYSAKARICTGAPSDASTCLTPQQAEAMDMIWAGPHNAAGERLWGGLPRGASLNVWLPKGVEPGANYVNFVKYWVEANPAWDWKVMNLASGLNSFESYFEKAYSLHMGATYRESADLDAFKNRGGKLIVWNGLSDNLSANPFGVYTYYQRLVERYGMDGTQSFARAFMYPGVSHCGGGEGPNPAPGDESGAAVAAAANAGADSLFKVVQDWAERDIEPSYVIAGQMLPNNTPRSRKVCKYPDQAVYKGSGSTDDEANFVCKVNASIPADIAAAAKTNHDR